MRMKTIAERAAEFEKRQEAKHARLDKVEESTTSEGIKALLAVNGGGAVAMLGFMQALLLKGAAFTNFKEYGANALLFFCAGIVFAVLIPCCRLGQVALERTDSDYSVYVSTFVSALWFLSLVAFLAGTGFAGAGIDVALK